MNQPVSQRRRHLMIAGVAGAVTPATAFADVANESLPQALAGRLVVSGRVVDADSKAISGALVEVSRGAHTVTDGDGRFVLALPDRRRRAPSVRVTNPGHGTQVARLTGFERDEAGALRTTLALTI